MANRPLLIGEPYTRYKREPYAYKFVGRLLEVFDTPVAGAFYSLD